MRPPLSASDSIVIFPTQPADSTGGQADFRGLLVEEDGCLKVVSDPPDDMTYPVIWPYGFSWRAEGGKIVVLDAEGTIVARVGERVFMGGGEGPGSDQEGCLRANKVWFAFEIVQILP